MPLVTCSDCQQPVSSEATACPACARPMRDRSYLTPMGEVVVGGLVLIACIAWPPLWGIFLLILVGRFVSRARRGSNRGAFIAGLALLVLTSGLVYVMPPAYAIILVAVGFACEVWLVVGRLGSMRTTT
jgi:Na+/melibiose symporter-like transporter